MRHPMRAIKPFTYNKQRLLPGDDFETKKALDSKLLVAAKKAVRSVKRTPGKIAPPPKAIAQQIEQSVAPQQLVSEVVADEPEKPRRRRLALKAQE